MKHFVISILVVLFASCGFFGDESEKTGGVHIEDLIGIAESDTVVKLANTMFEIYSKHVKMVDEQAEIREARKAGNDTDEPYSDEDIMNISLLSAAVVASAIKNIGDGEKETEYINYFMDKDEEFAKKIHGIYITL